MWLFASNGNKIKCCFVIRIKLVMPIAESIDNESFETVIFVYFRTFHLFHLCTLTFHVHCTKWGRFYVVILLLIQKNNKKKNVRSPCRPFSPPLNDKWIRVVVFCENAVLNDNFSRWEWFDEKRIIEKLSKWNQQVGSTPFTQENKNNCIKSNSR